MIWMKNIYDTERDPGGGALKMRKGTEKEERNRKRGKEQKMRKGTEDEERNRKRGTGR